MTVSSSGLEALNEHWALASVSNSDKEHAANVTNERLARRAVGNQIEFSFEEKDDDDSLLERIALAYEMAAIEGLDALSRPAGGSAALRDQASAAAYKAFDIRRLISVPKDTHERIFHVLHTSALAYCGDRWSDLRRWYDENTGCVRSPSIASVTWDQRLLFRIFECWVRLFRKDGWDDLHGIHEIVAGLREDQQTHEAESLRNGTEAADRALALRLVALYHWAKATEILAEYMAQGGAQTVFAQLDKHFDAGVRAAAASGDAQHEVILRWLHAASRIMVTSSLWWSTRNVNSRVTDFVRALTRREHQPMFQLLPPQRAALAEQGFLDQAKTAIVVDMPTSGGKTLLAQFRILQALNQFDSEQGWVAYVAPTRALSAQITRRLRRDFEPIGIRVEQLTGAVEVDAFEEDLLTEREKPFGVLVATPEKLSLVIRNKKVPRPLALVVMDEAHNLEAESRGLRTEFLLATIKQDCPRANFLLLMPFVESSDSIAKWLAQDISAGNAISFSTTPWKPNERIIGLYRAVVDDSQTAGWRLEYETLSVSEKTMKLRGTHRAGQCRPINVPKSKVLSNGQQKGIGLQTAAMAAILSGRGTSVAIANRIDTVWAMARHATGAIAQYANTPYEVELVQNFLRTEYGSQFELIDMLNHGVGVHHAGLSDEVRTLIEWLAEAGHLNVLCATQTIAQGMNFPVSAVFLQSHLLPYGVEMAPREFWNLAGRVGRIGHDSVGVIGIAEGTDRQRKIDFLGRATGALVSRLVTLLDELAERGQLADLKSVLWQDQWDDFRCYIAHLWAEKKNLDAVLADSEQLLRQTYGYTMLRNDPAQRAKADALLDATEAYARELANQPGVAELADATGFSPEGVRKARAELRNLEERLTPEDWAPTSLFGDAGKMSDLFGVMLKVPQLSKQLEEIGGEGFERAHLSKITRDWVSGVPLQEIARSYFADDDQSVDTGALTNACKAIYRSIVNNGTWGVSALSRISDLDFDKMSDDEKRQINSLPAMIYHGVSTEHAVLMRMNFAPRSAAEHLGALYKTVAKDEDASHSVGKARSFLKGLSESDWNRAKPADAALSGADYRKIWMILSGES